MRKQTKTIKEPIVKITDYHNVTRIPRGKIFWLNQVNEMLWQAHEIATKGASPHPDIQTVLDYYFAGNLTREQLEMDIFEIIAENTTPRETNDLQLNLF